MKKVEHNNENENCPCNCFKSHLDRHTCSCEKYESNLDEDTGLDFTQCSFDDL